MNAPVQVPDDTRLRLAHGCLQHLATGGGVRILHLKGVALHDELAAGRPPSSDCDVLVDPDAVETYGRALRAAGWDQVTTYAGGSVFGHAAAFHHRMWGTVDVHRTFPGLDRDPQATFETLWSAHTVRELGGLPCPVPELLAQQLLLLVHAARDTGERSRHDLLTAWARRSPQERQRIEDLAGHLGGLTPLAVATGRPELVRGGRGRALWEALHDGASPLRVWAARLRDARTVQEAVTILGAALRVNEDHLALRLGHAPSRRDLRREGWARWGRALRQGPRLLQSRIPGRRKRGAGRPE